MWDVHLLFHDHFWTFDKVDGEESSVTHCVREVKSSIVPTPSYPERFQTTGSLDARDLNSCQLVMDVYILHAEEHRHCAHCVFVGFYVLLQSWNGRSQILVWRVWQSYHLCHVWCWFWGISLLWSGFHFLRLPTSGCHWGSVLLETSWKLLSLELPFPRPWVPLKFKKKKVYLWKLLKLRHKQLHVYSLWKSMTLDRHWFFFRHYRMWSIQIIQILRSWKFNFLMSEDRLFSVNWCSDHLRFM